MGEAEAASYLRELLGKGKKDQPVIKKSLRRKRIPK